MINCHQNEKNGEKGYKMAVNSQKCVLLTFFFVFSNITFSNLWTMKEHGSVIYVYMAVFYAWILHCMQPSCNYTFAVSIC